MHYVLLVMTIRLAIWKIKRTQSGSHFYLAEDQEGYVASSYDTELVGKSGITLTALKPCGHIKVQDTPYQAVSEGGYVKKGTKIKIVRGEGARFIVKEDI